MAQSEINKIDINKLITTLEEEGLFHIEYGDMNREKEILRQSLIILDFEHFKNDLCKAFNNDNDSKYIFWKTLNNEEMNYSPNKRKRFYFILLFKYLKLSQLSKQNVIDIMTTLIHQQNNNIDPEVIERIIENKEINGIKLEKMIKKPNSNDLVNAFNILYEMNESNWDQIYKFLKRPKFNKRKITPPPIHSEQTTDEEEATDTDGSGMAASFSNLSNVLLQTKLVQEVKHNNDEDENKQNNGNKNEEYKEKQRLHQQQQRKDRLSQQTDFDVDLDINNNDPKKTQNNVQNDVSEETESLETSKETENAEEMKQEQSKPKQEVIEQYTIQSPSHDLDRREQSRQLDINKKVCFSLSIFYVFVVIDCGGFNIFGQIEDNQVITAKINQPTFQFTQPNEEENIVSSARTSVELTNTTKSKSKTPIISSSTQKLFETGDGAASTVSYNMERSSQEQSEQKLNINNSYDHTQTREEQYIMVSNNNRIVTRNTSNGSRESDIEDDEFGTDDEEETEEQELQIESSNYVDDWNKEEIIRDENEEKHVGGFMENKSKEQVIEILRKHIFISMRNGILNRHKDEIIENMQKLNINGQKLFELSQRKLVKQIMSGSNDEQYEELLHQLLTKLKGFNGGLYDNNDPYPKYIYKAIWYKSNDENLEKLIDDSVREVEKLDIWEKKDRLEALYDDGLYAKLPSINEEFEDKKEISKEIGAYLGTELNIDAEQEKDTYYDFVRDVYKDIGGNRFFNQFIQKNYTREIAMATIHNELKDNQIELKTEDDIINVLIGGKFDFEQFDMNQNGEMDFFEFEQFFTDFGYSVEKQQIRKIFTEIDNVNDVIDGYLTVSKFDAWRMLYGGEDLELRKREIRRMSKYKTKWYVYFNTSDGVYHFYTQTQTHRQLQYIATINDQQHEDNVKWAMYVNELTLKQQQRFEPYITKNIPNGYWKIMNGEYNGFKDGEEGKDVNDLKMAKHLRLIHGLLNNYYVASVSENFDDSVHNLPLTQLMTNGKDTRYCNNQQLLYVVGYICDNTSIYPSLRENKEIFLAYFRDRKVDGDEFIEMSKNQFFKELIDYYNNVEILKDSTDKIYKYLLDFDLTKVEDKETFNSYNIDPEIERNEEYHVPASIKYCTDDQIVHLINQICNEHPEDSDLMEDRELYINFCRDEDINGDYLYYQGKKFHKEFVRFCDERLQEPAYKLWEYLRRIDINAIPKDDQLFKQNKEKCEGYNIRFNIEREEYRLSWWNQRGKMDTNAICLKCEKKIPEDRTFYADGVDFDEDEDFDKYGSDQDDDEFDEDEEKKELMQETNGKETKPKPMFTKLKSEQCEIFYLRFISDPGSVQWQVRLFVVFFC